MPWNVTIIYLLIEAFANACYRLALQPSIRLLRPIRSKARGQKKTDFSKEGKQADPYSNLC